MFNLSENYHLRKCYLQRDQVPTQSMMKEKMSAPLAAIYFKSMSPKLKVIAGLEPPLKGGGTEWYVDPKELLQGRAVLKPISKQVLAKLNHHGIVKYGTECFRKHRKLLDMEIEDVVEDSDFNWRNDVTATTQQEWYDLTEHATNRNSMHMMDAYNRFADLYRKSLDKIETLFHDAVVAEIERKRDDALNLMQNKYAAALTLQATTLYKEYNEKLMKEKARLKAEFIQNVEKYRSELGDNIHDLKVDKRITVEKIRQYHESLNLACQIYVVLKEREEYEKERKDLTYKQRKVVKAITENIKMKDLEIRIEEQKVRERNEFYESWRKKVSHVVTKFQTFVSYCLNLLPDHAEFFINMEKLMLLQVNEAIEDATAESIIVLEDKIKDQQFHTPIPKSMPFYLFCDKSYKAEVNQSLCPKHSGGTSSVAQMPAIIIDKRCLYAACDNFQQFTNKIKGYIHGNRGDDADIKDDLIYEHLVPVKYTPSAQFSEVKLESSLLQILKDEMAHLKTAPDVCNFCQMAWCTCTPSDSTRVVRSDTKPKSSTSSGATGYKFMRIQRSTELEYEREPKWESYFSYVKSKKCNCDKMAQKHLIEHLPVYMRHMTYGPPEMPRYEMCSVATLKTMVKEARQQTAPNPVRVIPTKPKDVGTQFSDVEFEALCSCFSDDVLRRLLSNLDIDPTLLDSTWANTLDIKISSTYLTKRVSSFATARAHSLRNLIESEPDIKEIFVKSVFK